MLSAELDYLGQKPPWTGLQTVAMVQSERRSKGHTRTETRYFISSLPSHVAQIAQAVQTHWTIENSLHWVLDVSFHEDDCRIHSGNAPQNMALLRHVTLSLLA